MTTTEQMMQARIANLMSEIKQTMRQKAMMDFEEHRTFYPPRDWWEEWTWDNEETGEHLTQQEAREHIDSKIMDYADEMQEAILDTIRDF